MVSQRKGWAPYVHLCKNKCNKPGEAENLINCNTSMKTKSGHRIRSPCAKHLKPFKNNRTAAHLKGFGMLVALVLLLCVDGFLSTTWYHIRSYWVTKHQCKSVLLQNLTAVSSLIWATHWSFTLCVFITFTEYLCVCVYVLKSLHFSTCT